MRSDELMIDGREGEGGGQILRTALALSAITGRPLRITNVRGRRAKPGLLRQHLTGLRAAATVAGAEVSGASLGSSEIRFEPGSIRGGRYEFAVGSAGSCALVLQTVLPILAAADGPSELVVEGGTHAMSAPPFEFLQYAFLPRLRAMGLEARISLEAHGFYPAGGGRIRLELTPVERWKPSHESEAPDYRIEHVEALFAHVPYDVARRELSRIGARLQLEEAALRPRQVDSRGPGNALMLTVTNEAGAREVLTAFGRRGKRAESVADEVADATRSFLDSGAPVGEHLCDQLLIPMALAGEGSLRASAITEHTRTNAALIERFLPVRIRIEGTFVEVRSV